MTWQIQTLTHHRARHHHHHRRRRRHLLAMPGTVQATGAKASSRQRGRARAGSCVL